MADTNYPIPEQPVYNPNIRALQDSDPARASTIFNPLFERLIENTHAVKKVADAAQAAAEEAVESAGTAIPATQKGTPGGLAELDETGKVPSSQLPGYVDDVVDGYYHEGAFYSDLTHEHKITPESGKIYVDVESNITYRWSGTVYVAIGSDLALGETASTAYRGDRGKTAYDHSQIKKGNPHGTAASDIGYTDTHGLKAKDLQTAIDALAQRPSMDVKAAELKDAIADKDAVLITDSAEEDTLKRILWSKIKALFAAASHTHSASNITSGTLSAARGGTGQTTLTPTVTTKGVRQIYAGTSDMTAGSSSLTTGCIYLVYE